MIKLDDFLYLLDCECNVILRMAGTSSILFTGTVLSARAAVRADSDLICLCVGIVNATGVGQFEICLL